jgi:peptidoglycan/xylan/chitin deacetylase (PgdA/CDA1 family)
MNHRHIGALDTPLRVLSSFFFVTVIACLPVAGCRSATQGFSPIQLPPEKTQPNVTAPSPGALPAPQTSETATDTVPVKDTIEIVLTFDDGPHVEELGRGKNHTERVIRTLEDNIIQKGIRAVFFVQTHAPGRGGTQIGRDIIASVAKQGHVIGIHTGSTRDHASHRSRARARPYDADENGVLDRADGDNGLESDMIRAKKRIQTLAGSFPLYVRPTYGERDETVEATYRRQNLKMILWDIDSGDNTGSPGVDVVNQNIHEGMQRCIAAGKTQLVILFHDINSQTAQNLEEYLGNICIAARNLGKTVIFATSAEQIVHILNVKTYQ